MYQRILVPVDGSPTSQRGLNEAIELAKITKGCLRMLHVIDDLSFSLALDAYSGHPGEWMKQLRDGGGRILDAAKATAEAAGVEADTLLCDRVTGPVYEQVTTEANNWHADLIVLGTHGRRGIDRFVMGSSAEHILRHARIPVLLVRASEAATKAQSVSDSVKVHLPSAALSLE